MIKFGVISFPDAQAFIGCYHYAGAPHQGKYCYGAYLDGNLIATAVYIDSRSEHERVGELMACAKDPTINNHTFQISKLFSVAGRHLRENYDLIVSYADTRRGYGTIFQGASWAYDGIVPVGHYQLPVARHLYEPDHGYHLYWKALNNTGHTMAATFNLRSLQYIRRKPQFMVQNAHV